MKFTKTAEETSWAENLVPYGPNPAETLAKILDEFGLNDGRIGMEFGYGMRLGMTLNEFESFRKLAKAQLVDGTSAMWKLRSIKSPFEIDRTSFLREFRSLAQLHSHLAILNAPQVRVQGFCLTYSKYGLH